MSIEDYSAKTSTSPSSTLMQDINSTMENIEGLDLNTTKKAVRRDDIPKDIQKNINNLNKKALAKVSGVNGYSSVEPSPIFLKAENEKVLKGENESYIVLGRDRVGDRSTGYGGQGHTQCAAIDIVVGRLGSNEKFIDDEGNNLYVDADFERDSARIYISQKTNIDQYFSIADGNSNIKAAFPSSQGRSGIGIKADDVRVVSRNTIKLVTLLGGKNSAGGNNNTYSGIALIANNDPDALQPLVKGRNLKNCIRELVDLVDDLRVIFEEFVDKQMKYNEVLFNHKHFSPFYGKETSESPTCMMEGIIHNMGLMTDTTMSLKNFAFNLSIFEKDYIEQYGDRDKYILSKFNYTN